MPRDFDEWKRTMGKNGLQPPARLSEVATRIRDLSAVRWGPERALEIVGTSAALESCLNRAAKFASFSEPVLLLGESGVGKESFAQAIHLLGGRRKAAFVTANCPQLEDANLTVSELFGHLKGSFTGAVSDRKGCFELAENGTIFLDEIGDLPSSAQAVLLRSLSSGYFRSLGSSTDKKAEARVVAATNRHLNKLVAKEEFRHDLLYRLRAFEVEIPPLRRRDGDWLLLLEHYLARMVEQYGSAKKFSNRSLYLLEKYSWPGNVRDVIRVVGTGYALADGASIEPEHFRDCLRQEEEPVKTGSGDLLRRLILREGDFWTLVHKPFLERDLNRNEVLSLMEEGLRRADGSYKVFGEMIGLEAAEYQRLMGFLRHHRLKPEGFGGELAGERDGELAAEMAGGGSDGAWAPSSGA